MNINQLKSNIQFKYVIRNENTYLQDNGFLCANILYAMKFDTYKDAKIFLNRIYNPFNKYKVVQIKNEY